MQVTECFFKEKLLHCVLVFFLLGGLHDQVDDTPEYHRVEVWVSLGNVLCQPGGYGSPLYLGQEAELRIVRPHQSLDFLVSEHGVAVTKDLCSVLSGWGRGPCQHGGVVAWVV